MPHSRRAGTKVSHRSAPRTHPWLLGALSDAARAALLRAGVERHYAPDEVLYLAGSPAGIVYLVLDGCVRLVRESNGRPLFIHDEPSGGCLGEVPVFEGTTYPATALAAEPTRCLLLPRRRRDRDRARARRARIARTARATRDRGMWRWTVPRARRDCVAACRG